MESYLIEFEFGILSLLFLILSIASLIFWILQLIRLFKRKNKTDAILVLVVGIIFCFIGLIFQFPLLWIVVSISFLLGRRGEKKEIKKKMFWCGSCNTKLLEEFLGGETICERKICRFCLEKKERDLNFRLNFWFPQMFYK